MSLFRVVVDTNIAVSGLLFGGVPLKIIELAVKSKFRWVTSPFLIEEMERVLSSKKFGLSSEEIVALPAPIFDVCEIVVPQQKIDFIKRCPPDNRVLECAVEGICSYIVTGDRKDLLSLENYGDIKIISARAFLDKFT